MEFNRGQRYKKGPTTVIDHCSEVEIGNVDYEKIESFFKDVPPPQSQLSSVEVQINDSAKNIVFATVPRPSALLDVTVIRPNDASLETTVERNILTSSQVKELLVSIDKLRMEKKDILNSLFENEVQDTIVQISSHKKPMRKHVASDGAQANNIHSMKNKRRVVDYDRERRKIITSSAPVNDRRERRRTGYLSDIRETVDPLFVGLKESLRNVEARITAMQVNIDSNQTPPETYTIYNRATKHQKIGDSVNTQHIYRTAHGSRDMKIPLICHTKYDDASQANKPCLCQHCGMVGLISEQQKYPIVAHSPDPKEMLRKNKNERNKQTETHYPFHEKHIAYLQELAERVRILEERLEYQEERAVPKDYFKRIITKIVSHFSAKTAKLQNEIPSYRDEYRRKMYPDDIRYAHFFNETAQYQQHAFVNTPFMTHKDDVKNDMKNTASKNVSADVSPDNSKRKLHRVETFWKWGGEILKPGIDLKNKIMSLIEITLTKLRNTGENSHNQTNKEEEGKNNKQQARISESRMKNDDFEYCFTSGNGQVYSLLRRPPQKEECDIFKPLEMPDFIKNKDYLTRDNARYTEFEKRYAKQSFIPRPVSSFKPQMREDPKINVDIAYVNPNIESWKEESSSNSIRVEYADDYSVTNNGEFIRQAEKKEFLRVLAHTKDDDKERLWQSIWNQAKLNGQSKSDKVTIQIPKQQHLDQNSNKGGDIIEIEFTIGDLEYMLVKNK